MSTQTYLLDTNIIINLEDNRAVDPAFSEFIALSAKHKIKVFVHEAAKDDISRDKDINRQKISLSKLNKYQTINKYRGLNSNTLTEMFGSLARPNDVVDATLLHALVINAADFLVTQDKGLRDRAKRYSAELERRILYIADAVQLLKTTYEPNQTQVRFIEEVQANEIPLDDQIFDSLREGYPGFDDWWREKCVNQHRSCWIIDDDSDGITGLVVTKDETFADTDATQKLSKILKICTFKVSPDKRGTKLGELLLKKIFWFAQKNRYDLIYLTTYEEQISLIDLLEYYGFRHTMNKSDGERIYEKQMCSHAPVRSEVEDSFKTHRLNYPRFVIDTNTKAYGIPIKEDYHDILYPDLLERVQYDLFDQLASPKRPGNTIRKVYLCRAQCNLTAAGSILFFYKSKSKHKPSQSLTAIGILEDMQVAKSTQDLVQMTGGRSVYSQESLQNFNATQDDPVKVINYTLAAYITPPVSIEEMRSLRIVGTRPPQSIYQISNEKLYELISSIDLGFSHEAT